MNDELKMLLLCLAIAAPVGVIVGIAARMLTPTWCKGFSKFSHKKWPFLFYFIVMAAFAAICFLYGNPLYGGIFFSLFAVLQLVCFFGVGSSL